MLVLVKEKIERYCEDHTAGESELLKELAKETYAKTEMPQMLVGRLEGTFLKLLVQLTRARRVLEIGTFTGYSALSMAEGLPANGEIITCDIDPDSTAIAKRYWAGSPHGKKIKLKLGAALETLKTIKGPFDLVFVDADKANYLNYWKACFPKIRRGGLLVADNALWSGRVLDPQDEDSRAIHAFNEYVSKDPKAQTLLLPIRDGMLLALKT